MILSILLLNSCKEKDKEKQDRRLLTGFLAWYEQNKDSIPASVTETLTSTATSSETSTSTTSSTNSTTETNSNSSTNSSSATNTGTNSSSSTATSSNTNSSTSTSWSQQAYIKAPNAGSTDFFGWSAAISSDTIVVGATSEDSNQTTITNGTTANTDNSVSGSGAAYVFKRSGTTWAQEAYLKAPNAESSDSFGQSVAIDSDTIAIGAVNEDSNQTTITNGTTASSNNSATKSGAVYVFKRSGSTWTQEAYLKAPNAEGFDQFGQSVAISSDTIVVGAFNEDSNQTTITNGTSASSNNSNAASGAVYVFKRSGTTWTQEAYLKAPNGEGSDNFGWSVAISSDTIVVGATAESSNQTTITNGTTASSNNSASGSGAAYVFKRSGTTWTQEAYLKAPNAEGSDQFGWSVAINSNTIVVSAIGEDSDQTTVTNGATGSSNNSASSAGAVYVFKRSGTTWSQEAYLKAPNSGADDSFGQSVAIYSDLIAVGASAEDSNQNSITNGTTASTNNTLSNAGAAYIFTRSGTTWSQEAYFKAYNVGGSDAYGYSVGVYSNTMIVAATLEDSSQTTITNGTTASTNDSLSNSGAVYVYTK